MTWEIDSNDKATFTCGAEGCKQSLAAHGSNLYEAFLYAREAGWYAVLNEQFCPKHVKEAS